MTRAAAFKEPVKSLKHNVQVRLILAAGQPKSGKLSGPSVFEQPKYTDSYFNLTRSIVTAHKDSQVTYAVFMRRPVTGAAISGRLAEDDGF